MGEGSGKAEGRRGEKRRGRAREQAKPYLLFERMQAKPLPSQVCVTLKTLPSSSNGKTGDGRGGEEEKGRRRSGREGSGRGGGVGGKKEGKGGEEVK